MSKLNDLITKLCLGGVQYRKLDEVAEIKRGRRVVKKELSQDSNSGYPVYQNSLKPLGYHTCSNEKAGTPFVIAAGSAGEIGYSDVDYWGADDCYSIECDDNTVNGRYIYHVLLLKQGRIKSQVRRASIPRLSSTAIRHLEIPVPPIEVQHEVVRILDSFTELEAELEAELADRKKQYEYFRGRLLDDKNLERMDGEPVETKKLGDVSRVFGGYAFKSKEYTVSGARVMRISDVQAGYISNENAKYCPIDQPKQADSARLFANDLLVSLTGNVGRVAMVDNTVLPAYLNQRVAGLRATDAINYRFLFHYLNQHQFIADCERAGKGSAQKNLSMGYLTNYEIPVPSIATQKRVVDILDRFDALTTSLTDGIPAEIAMRREQYEYYRSRLLDFPRLPEDSDSDGNVE